MLFNFFSSIPPFISNDKGSLIIFKILNFSKGLSVKRPPHRIRNSSFKIILFISSIDKLSLFENNGLETDLSL